MTRCSPSAFAVKLVVLLATSFLCSNVEAIRGKGSSGDQCLEEDQYLNDEDIFSDEPGPRRSHLLVPPRTSISPLIYQFPQRPGEAAISPRPSSAHPSSLGSVASVSPRPPLASPREVGSTASSRVVSPRPRTYVSYPSGAPDPNPFTATPRQDLVPGTRYASVYLVDEAGRPTGQFVVVLIDAGGQVVGIPTFQASPTIPAADGPPPQTGLIEHVHTVSVPHAPHQSHSRNMKVVHGVEKVVVAADIAATAVATYQVEQTMQHGGNMAAAVQGAHAHPIPAIGHQLQHMHLIGHGAQASGAIAAGSAGLSVFAVAVNGYQCKVSHQNIQAAQDWKEKIREGSGPMSPEEYDHKMEQTNAFIEYEEKTVALSATAASGAAVSGILGGFIAAGTAPGWAPPVMLGVCIGTAGVGAVQLGRWAFSPKPELPEIDPNTWNPDETETSDSEGEEEDSLLELSALQPQRLQVTEANGNQLVVDPPVVLPKTRKDTDVASALSDDKVPAAIPTNKSEDISTATAVRRAYLEKVFLPRWSFMYGKKFALMPFYIDLLFRNLRSHFGGQVKYIHTLADSDETRKMFGAWAIESWSRETLTYMCQQLDDPHRLLFQVDTESCDLGPKGSSKLMPHREAYSINGDDAFAGLGLRPTYSARMPRANSKDRDMRCDDKGPTPDTYCEETFGIGNRACCQMRIVNNAFPHLVGDGFCGACPDYQSKGPIENYDSGVRAVLEGETVQLSIFNVEQFKQFTHATLEETWRAI